MTDERREAAAKEKPAAYNTEDGELFWIKATSTADDARALIRDMFGIEIDPSQVSLVHGFEHTKHGEPWFTKTAKGTEFWELANE